MNTAVIRYRNIGNMPGKVNRSHPYSNKQTQGISPGFPAGASTVMADGPVQTENFINSETFHTPSFGDEDFDINTLSLPVSENLVHTSDSISQVFSTAQQAVLSHPPLGNMDLSRSIISSLETSVAPKFPPQNFEVPDISITNSLNSLSHFSGTRFVNMNNSPVSSTELTTICPQNVGSQLQFKSGQKQTSPLNSSNSTSPNRESSDDSDDSLPLAQLALMKRQAMAASASVVSPSHDSSPEPPTSTTTTTTPAKKQKTPKKKKKKDPNEPQKPVSAYALFFRDTQAAIKGQNPNASFGEVSKIVASMWDGLDPEHKNSYKKKTEMAKKEYLKQLAAYRASLVSQTGIGEGFSVKPVGGKKSQLQPQDVGETSAFSVKPARGKKTPFQMSPDESNGLSPLRHNTGALQSPIHVTQSSMSPPQPDLMDMMGGMQPLSATSPPHTVMGYNSPPQLPYQQGLPDLVPRPMMDQQMMDGGQSVQYSKWCIRNGCSNVALDNPGWDNEYCSNECVVSHCRDVFTAWVASRQGSSSFQVK